MQVVKTQKVTLSFGTGDSQKDGALSGFTTLAQIVPFTASAEIDTNSASMAQCKFDVEITSTTNVRATRGGSGIAATVIVYVVEFASDVNVIKGSWSIGSGATTDDNTISAVTLADAFVWHFHKSTQTSVAPNQNNTASQLQSTTNVRLHVNTAGTAHDGHFYVVEHSDLSVQRGVLSSDASPANQTITAVTLAESFSIMSMTSTETQYEDEGNAFGHLTSTTNFQCYPGYTSGNNSYYWQVISDSEFGVQRFNVRNTATASGSFTLTSVDTDFTVAHAGHMIATNSSSEYDDAWDLSCRCTSYDLTSSTNINWAKDTNNGSAVCEAIEFTEYVPPNPTITDAGDEDFEIGETNIVVTGTNFGATQGSGKVELGDSATYGSATLVTQSIDTWSDTSIQFDLSIGSLSQESLWLYVTDDSSVTSNAWAVNVNMTPSITDAGDEDFEATETNIVVTGTVFRPTQGTGKLELGDSATYGTATLVTQSIDSWSDTSIQFDMTMGGLTDESLWLYVTNDLGFVSNAWAVNVNTIPAITDAGDELFELTETNIVLTGTTFQPTQSTGKVELVNSATYATGTKVTQSIDTWSDTSIQFDLVIGGLTEINLWLYVTNNLGVVSSGYPVQVYRTPTITDIEDEEFTVTETNIIMDGTYFEDTQNSGKVELSDNSVYALGTKVVQTINSWSDTQINFDLVIGTHSVANLFVFVTNDIGRTSSGYAVTITNLPINYGLWKTSGIQTSIKSTGLNTTVFLIRDE